MKSSKKTDGKLPARPVFYDPTSHRLVFFTFFFIFFVVLAAAWFVFFIAHLYESELPENVAENAPPAVESDPQTAPQYQFGRQNLPTITGPTPRDGDGRPAPAGAPVPTRPAPPGDASGPAVHAFIPRGYHHENRGRRTSTSAPR